MKKKNVLITGASRGIGMACARRFAQEDARADYRLFLNCHSSVQELEGLCNELTAQGVFCIPVPADVGNSEEINAIFDTIEQNCEGIDLLINNAGISHIGLLSDLTDAEWDRILRTNLSSAFYTCRRAIPHMVSEKAGKILNISSMWGRTGASCEAAYSASKAGLQGLTMALAKELAPSNIQVNAIACGVIDTVMNQCLSSKERKALADEIPAGRFGTPEEVAELVFQLACAPSYLTGQIIGLDGGFI